VNPVRFTDFRLQAGMLAAVITFVTACAPSNTAAPPAATVATAGTGANSGTTASTSAAPMVATVTMSDALRFEPATLTVARGATVTWRNTSATMHTVTDDPGKAVNKADAALPSDAQPWDSGNIDPGQTFQHTFDTPGTYKYFCTPHEAAGMVATITVTG
jgi:plastocyanin